MTFEKTKITRITESGLIYINLEDNRLNALEFGKIKGYKGESLKELKKFGLKINNFIDVELKNEQVVQAILKDFS